MLTETLARFALGGSLVALFAIVGSVLEPKTFAGIFGAAPSVALASLAMTYARHTASYVAVEGRSMIGGSAALLLYSATAAVLVRRYEISPWLAATLLWGEWFGIAVAAWALLGGGG